LLATTSCVLVLFVNQSVISSGAQRFFDLAEALCWAVGKAIRPGFIQAAMAVLVMARIRRVRGILLALEARFLAGRVWPRARRTVVVSGDVVSQAGAVRAAYARPLPNGFAWLCPLVPGDAACYAGHLRVVLEEPGMQALLAACPQAVRVLGPLCRMLGIARVEYVPGAAEAARERALRVRAPRVRRVKVVVEDPRVAHYASTGVPRRFWFKVPGL
jgi:hypothetical protein